MNFLEYFTHPLVFAFGMTLVHSLWQITLIALVWRFTIYLTRNSGPCTNYNISLGSLLAIPLIFLVTFIRQLSVYGNSVNVASVSGKNILSMLGETREILSITETQAPVITRQIEIYSPLIVWLYLIFVVILSGKTLLDYARINSLRTRNLSNLPDYWQSQIEELVSRTGLRKAVPVFLSPRISIPIVTGFIKPVILLPLAMFSSLDVRQVEAILLHELYHLRNYDHWVNTIQNFLEILFFFHPATWWISAQVRHEREKKVDEQVVYVTGRPLLYAKALLTLETKRQINHQAAIAAINSKNHLLIRIKKIMTMKTKKANPGRKTAAILAILISVITITALNTISNSSFATTLGINNLKDIPDVQTLPELKEIQDLNNIAEVPENYTYAIPDTGSVNELEEAKEISRENRGTREQPDREISYPDVSDEVRLQLEQAREQLKEIEMLDPEEFKAQMQASLEEMDMTMQKLKSGELREEMLKAREEMDRAMHEFDSRKFREEMQKAQEEMKRAIQEFDSPEFREEMRKAQEEMRKAMQEFNSEEFKEQMRRASEEMKTIIQQFDSEEFKEQMRKAREEIRTAASEFNTEEFREEMRKAQEEIKRVIEELKLEEPEY
ncbi:MAG: M56 family metallopeptidase [Bacteroidales bacterium]